MIPHSTLIGSFYPMPTKILKSDLRGKETIDYKKNPELLEVLFYLWIARTENLTRMTKKYKIGEFEMSERTLVNEFGINKSQARKLIKKFEDAGYIELVKKSNNPHKKSVYRNCLISTDKITDKITDNSTDKNEQYQALQEKNQPITQPINEPINEPLKINNKINNKIDNEIQQLQKENKNNDVVVVEKMIKSYFSELDKFDIKDIVEALNKTNKDIGYLEEKLKYTKSQNVRNVRAFLISAIKENYNTKSVSNVAENNKKVSTKYHDTFNEHFRNYSEDELEAKLLKAQEKKRLKLLSGE